MTPRKDVSPARSPFVLPGEGFEAWAGRIGYFPFHRELIRNVEMFRDTFGFDLRFRPEPPAGEGSMTVAFWVTLPGWGRRKDYALFGRVMGRSLEVLLGWAEAGREGTQLIPFRELGRFDSLQHLTELEFVDWFCSLVRMHCEKL